MRAITPLIRRGLRTHPGQGALTALLVLVTALLLSIAVLLVTSYPDGLETTKERLHGEDVSLILATPAAAEAAVSALEADDRVTQVAEQEVLTSACTLEYNDSDTATICTFATLDATPELGRTEVVTELESSVTDPVWVPIQLRDGGGYRLGDTLTLTIAGTDRNFHIQGFLTTLFGSSLNMGQYTFLLETPAYDDLADEPGIASVTTVRALVTGGSEAVSSEITDQVTEAAGSDTVLYTLDFDTLVEGNSITANMFAIMLSAFALIVAIIALTVIRFAIRSGIARDMQAVGTLKATGFTSGQIMAFTTAPWALITLASATVGVIAAAPLLALIRTMLNGQTGIPWETGSGVLAAAVTVAILLIIVTLTGLGAARSIRQLPPTDALRGGLATHTFRPNRLPLSSTRGSVARLLGLKLASRQPGQQFLMAMMMALLAWASTFAAGMYTNVLGDPQEFSLVILGDNGDVAVRLAPGTDEDQVTQTVAEDPGVARAFGYAWQDATLDGSNRVVSMVVTDDFSAMEQDGVYQGRAPEHPDEIALGGYAAEATTTTVGDEVTVIVGGTRGTYLVTGLVQSGLRRGMNGLMTTDGFQRLDPAYSSPEVIAYLAEGADPGQVQDRLRTDLAADADSVLDMQEYYGSIMGSYMSMSLGLAVGIIAITALVVLIVTTLTTSTFLREHHRGLATFAALGMRRKEQTRLVLSALLPVVAAGTALGLLVGAFTFGPALTVMLRAVGIRHLETELPLLPEVAIGLGMVTLAALLVWALTNTRREMSARELMAD